MSEKEYYSASTLSKYRQCPKLYQLGRQWVSDSSTLAFGTAIHAGIAGMLQRRNFLDEFRATLVLQSTIPTDEMIDRAKAVYEYILSLPSVIDSAHILAVESNDCPEGMFYADIPGQDTWGLKGIFDLVLLRGDTIEIIDWKTGQSWPSDNLQLATYALAAKAIYGGEKIKTSFVFVEQKKIKSFDWNHESLLAAEKAIGQIIDQLSADSDFQPKVGDHCAFCPINDRCEAYRGIIQMKPVATDPLPEAIPANLPLIMDRLQVLRAYQSAAEKIIAELNARQKKILADAGGSLTTESGYTYRLVTRPSRYEYDLPSIWMGTQEIIGQPPLSICQFSPGGFDELLKAVTPDQKKKLNKLKTQHRKCTTYVSYVQREIGMPAHNTKEEDDETSPIA